MAGYGSYGMIYKRIFQSSVSDHWEAMITFIALIALADENDIVMADMPRLARATNIPIEILRKGMEILLSPDPTSATEIDDGRRIDFLPLVGDDRPPSLDGPCRGWKVKNREKYRLAARREYMRLYMRRRRSERLNPNQEEISGRQKSKAAKEELEDFRRP